MKCIAYIANISKLFLHFLFVQILTAHKRWEVFRGDSNEPDDLIFSTKKSSMLQVKTELDVFLASNTSNVPDFKVKASWIERSGTIYAGDIVIGQVRLKPTSFQP